MFFVSLLLCDHVGLSAMACAVMVVLHAGYIASLDRNNEYGEILHSYVCISVK